MYNENIHNHFFCFRKTGSTVYRTWTTLSEPVETRHQQVRALETGVVLGRKPRYRLRKKTVEEKKRRRRPKRRPKIDADAARRRWARRGAVASTNEWNGHHIFFCCYPFLGSRGARWFRFVFFHLVSCPSIANVGLECSGPNAHRVSQFGVAFSSPGRFQ